MPTYEYRCPACGNDFELFQRISEVPGAECPGCGQQAVRRLSAGAGLLFKGSGFYITDYRNDSYKQQAKSEAGKNGSATGDSKPASGGESKPSATSESKPPASGTSGKSE